MVLLLESPGDTPELQNVALPQPHIPTTNKDKVGDMVVFDIGNGKLFATQLYHTPTKHVSSDFELRYCSCLGWL